MSNIHAIFAYLSVRNQDISSTLANIWKLLHLSGEKNTPIHQVINKHHKKGFPYISVWFLKFVLLLLFSGHQMPNRQITLTRSGYIYRFPIQHKQKLKLRETRESALEGQREQRIIIFIFLPLFWQMFRLEMETNISHGSKFEKWNYQKMNAIWLCVNVSHFTFRKLCAEKRTWFSSLKKG